MVNGVNFAGLRDAGDPVELARRYEAEGADELTFLDVSASKQGRGTMLEVVRSTAEQVFIPLTVGGGVRSADDVNELLRAGADKVSINTAAIARPELLRELRAGYTLPPAKKATQATQVTWPPQIMPRLGLKSPPMVARSPRAWMLLRGYVPPKNSGWAKFC